MKPFRDPTGLVELQTPSRTPAKQQAPLVCLFPLTKLSELPQEGRAAGLRELGLGGSNRSISALAIGRDSRRETNFADSSVRASA